MNSNGTTKPAAIPDQECPQVIQRLIVELEQIMLDLDRFLGNFVEGLRRSVGERSSTPPTQGRDEPVEATKDDWTAKRACVEQELRRQVDLLSEAWLKLEAEQRNLLRERSCTPNGKNVRPEKNNPLSGHKPVKSRAEPSLTSTMNKSMAAAAMSNQSVLDFEKLRREIRSSRASG